MEQITNQIILRGSLLSLPRFSHENHGKKFYRFTLEVPRLSGTSDLLPIVAEEKLVEDLDPDGGEMIRVEGQVRGVRKMVESDAYCTDILTQVSAIQAALNAFNRELLAEHIRTCVADDIKNGKEETIDELVLTLQKMMK